MHTRRPRYNSSSHCRNHSQTCFFNRDQSSHTCNHDFGANFQLLKMSASGFSYKRKFAFRYAFTLSELCKYPLMEIDDFGLYFTDIGGLHMTSSKDDCANYDQFLPNFDMACKTIQHVSVPYLKLFRPKKREKRKEKRVGRRSWRISVMLYGKMGCWAFFCLPTWLPQYKRMEIN